MIGLANLSGPILTGPKGRIIVPPCPLAILKRLGPEPVLPERLAIAMWGRKAPYMDHGAIRVQVHRLRGFLANVGAGVTVKGRRLTGYWIEEAPRQA